MAQEAKDESKEDASGTSLTKIITDAKASLQSYYQSDDCKMDKEDQSQADAAISTALKIIKLTFEVKNVKNDNSKNKDNDSKTDMNFHICNDKSHASPDNVTFAIDPTKYSQNKLSNKTIVNANDKLNDPITLYPSIQDRIESVVLIKEILNNVKMNDSVVTIGIYRMTPLPPPKIPFVKITPIDFVFIRIKIDRLNKDDKLEYSVILEHEYDGYKFDYDSLKQENDKGKGKGKGKGKNKKKGVEYARGRIELQLWYLDNVNGKIEHYFEQYGQKGKPSSLMPSFVKEKMAEKWGKDQIKLLLAKADGK